MSKLLQNNGQYQVVPDDCTTTPALDPGAYSAWFDQLGILNMAKSDIVSDKIVDIPSPQYFRVVEDINVFLKPETKKKYQTHGFVYKRSFLLHGAPGTGKSCLVNRVANEVINLGGIVLCDTNGPSTIKEFLSAMRDINPDRLIMVILEEFDGSLRRNGEGEYLTLLDGQKQIQNVIYMATTNNFDKIPKRIIRPGRFSRVLEIGYPDIHARHSYLNTVFPELSDDQLSHIVIATSGCSIDEVKEVVLAHSVLGDDLDSVVRNLLAIRGAVEVKAEFQAPVGIPFGQLLAKYPNPYLDMAVNSQYLEMLKNEASNLIQLPIDPDSEYNDTSNEEDDERQDSQTAMNQKKK